MNHTLAHKFTLDSVESDNQYRYRANSIMQQYVKKRPNLEHQNMSSSPKLCQIN